MEFEEFVASRGPALSRLAWLLTHDRHATEDLLQSAFVDLYRHWGRVAASDAPEAYARRVLLNRFLTDQRRRSSTERPREERDLEAMARAVPDPAEELGTRDELRRLVQALPPRRRAVLVLRYYEDRTDEQIAHLLGVSASTVRATASRAIATLRTALRPEPEGTTP